MQNMRNLTYQQQNVILIKKTASKHCTPTIFNQTMSMATSKTQIPE